MKLKHTFLARIPCPRCQARTLTVSLRYYELKSGNLRRPFKVTEEDTNPACQWATPNVPVTPEQARIMLNQAMSDRAAENSVTHPNNG